MDEAGQAFSAQVGRIRQINYPSWVENSKSIYKKEYRLLLEKLKNRRRELGISQEKLSKSLGRAETFISKVERGERRLDAFELILLARALELDPKIFFAAYVDAIEAM